MSLHSVPAYCGHVQLVNTEYANVPQMCYVEVHGHILYYWPEAARYDLDTPQGSIDLCNVAVADAATDKCAWSLQDLHTQQLYLFVAASEQERAMWMARLTCHMTSSAHIQTSLHDDGEERVVFARPRQQKISLNDFEVTAVIGRGSFGRVYQVRKKGTGEVYAMKEMSKDVVERENLTEHIFAEKSILQTIAHPFIVNLHYAFQTADRLYLVLDLLSGGELFFHLGQVGVFDEYRAKYYTAEIALALGYLHSLNIIYRDLKPENAVLDKDGHVCLTDFGLAKTNVCDDNACTFCGTPEYLAPEFLLGSPHGKAVDWWSLGILFYEMLMGMPPYYSENVDAMYEAILSEPLHFNPDTPISDDAKDLLTRLLDRDPATRLQSVDELRRHALFRDLDFDLLYERQVPPPFRPDPDTLNNFDNQFTTQSPNVAYDDDSGEHANIAGFTYDSDGGCALHNFGMGSPVLPSARTGAGAAVGGASAGDALNGSTMASANAADATRAGLAATTTAAAATAVVPLLQPTRSLLRDLHGNGVVASDADASNCSRQGSSVCASPPADSTAYAGDMCNACALVQHSPPLASQPRRDAEACVVQPPGVAVRPTSAANATAAPTSAATRRASLRCASFSSSNGNARQYVVAVKRRSTSHA